MKKTVLVALIATAIIATLTLNSYAMNGQGNGKGGGNGFGKSLSQQERDYIHSLSEDERRVYMEKIRGEKYGYQGRGKNNNHQSRCKNKNGSNFGEKGEARQAGHKNNSLDLLKNIPLQDLSEEEKEMLYYSYAEETLARDIYNYFYDLYGVQTFKNIAQSEENHRKAVKSLLDRYGLEAPTGYGVLTETYNNLKAEGEKGLKEALEVGVKIEILDIEDIAKHIEETDNDDFKIIFTNIGGGSFNHLRGFLNTLTNNGFETEIDYSKYLSEEELNLKGGELKTKMAELVQSRGVVLPNQASPESIAKKCNEEEKTQNQLSNDKVGKRNSNSTNFASYKNLIETKYKNILDNMSEEKLLELESKLESLKQKIIENNNYSFDKKTLYITIIDALNSSINDRLKMID